MALPWYAFVRDVAAKKSFSFPVGQLRQVTQHPYREVRFVQLDVMGRILFINISMEGEVVAVSRIRDKALASMACALRPLDRQLVLLFLEGLEPSEMSDATGLSETNVTTRVSRLRATLRNQLLERYPNDLCIPLNLSAHSDWT